MCQSVCDYYVWEGGRKEQLADSTTAGLLNSTAKLEAYTTRSLGPSLDMSSSMYGLSARRYYYTICYYYT